MSNHGDDDDAVRAATRGRAPGWRDPRLWIGIVLVAASVVAGARLLAGADRTVAVWASVTDHGAGDRLVADDLTAVRVRFADDAALEDYLEVDDALPADVVLTRGVGAGELVPRGALGSAADTGLVDVPLAVDPEQVPASVVAGAVVDVYLTDRTGTAAPEGGSGASAPGGPALAGVGVLDAPQVSDGFGTTGRRQIVVAVPEDDAAAYFAQLAASPDPVVTVVRRG